MDTQSPDSAPTALADLIAAGLVSHEMIGDPGRLGPEASALRVLCGLIAGPVWRIEPFHYAFRAGAGDLGGALGGQAPEDWAGALEAALQGALGPEAVWVSATDLAADLSDDAGDGEAALLDQPLLVLRAQGEAIAGGLAAAGPELQAVVNARVAVETARLASAAILDASFGASLGAGLDTGLDARLAAIEARQAEIQAGLAAQAETTAALGALGVTLETVLRRLDAQADVVNGHIAREDMVAGRLAELSAMAGAPAAFQETLGVTLAEFLARLESRAEVAPARVPQFS